MSCEPQTVSNQPDASRVLWSRSRLPLGVGLAALLGIAGLGLSSLLALLWQAKALHPAMLWQEPWLAGVMRFSLWQAGLSTLLSVVLAVPVAVALARRPHFVGRRVLLRAMELSLVIPTLIALFGLVAVHGRQGWAAPLRDVLGWPADDYLYGLSGIVLAHVFYNLPLCARLMLQALETAPQAHWRLAGQLGLSRMALWRTLEWPRLSPLLPRLAALVFTLCFTSFAIVMTLGGGPGSATLEVAIYQAIKFDNDIALAALLALTQLTICLSLWLIALSRGGTPSLGVGAPVTVSSAARWWRPDQAGFSRWVDAGWLLALALLLLPPLVAVVVAGLGGLVDLPQMGRLWPAALRSLAMALAAGLGGVGLALALLVGRQWLAERAFRRLAMLIEGAGQLILVIPALVLGTGLFLLLRPTLGSGWQGYGLVVLVNAVMALPFAIQVLRGAIPGMSAQELRLADQFGVQGAARLRWLVWPHLRRPLSLALAYAMTLSLGDFSVIALFGSPTAPTLPMLLYQQLGSYRFQGASATALVLLMLVVLVFAVLDRLTRHPRRHHAPAVLANREASHARLP